MSDFTALLWTVLIGGVLTFAGLELAVLIHAFRNRPAPSLPEGAKSRRGLEIAWLATPAVILVSLVAWSGVVLGKDVRFLPGDPDLTVHITGKQFVWEIRHEMPSGEAKVEIVETLNQLHLPAGKTVRIDLESKDVVHSFWVPQLRVKQDVPPGQPQTLWIRPLETGEFNIVCAELCGNSHYAMRGFVHVVSPEDFGTWFAENRVQPGSGAEPSPARRAR